MWYMYVIEISFKQMDKLVNIKEEVERDLYSKVRIKWASACTCTCIQTSVCRSHNSWSFLLFSLVRHDSQREEAKVGRTSNVR